MKNRKPILLLGAGFSFGARNEKEEELLMGKKLSEALYNRFYELDEDTKTLSQSIKESLKQNKENLSAICSALRAQGLVEQRNDYIVSHFSGCHVDSEAPQRRLLKYPWSYIFTLNVDDLVENIYKEAGIPLSVLDFSHPYSDDSPEITRLIKLHGSVCDKTRGFIFDEEEYIDYTIDLNSLLREFANQAMKNDLIMVGTEFNERDLLTILKLYETCGYNREPYKRFYITPNLSNLPLQLKVEKSTQDNWIVATTEQFLSVLDKKIAIPNSKKDILHERGVYFLSDVNKQMPSNLGIYKGEESVYADFFHDADIRIPEADALLKTVESYGKRLIITFSGEEYIGKTCFAKRLLVNLYHKGYNALQIHFLDKKVSKLLIEYLGTLDKGSKLAIYIDHAAYSYYEVIELIEKCPDNLGGIVVLTEDTKENHDSKRYILLDEDYWIEYIIKPIMNDQIAQAVFEKLASKKRLGHYLDYIPPKANVYNKRNKSAVVQKIKQEQDVIDALYFSSEGKSFIDHYSSWISRRVNLSERKVIQKICCLCKLGISSIPIILFEKIGKKSNPSFSSNEFLTKFSDIFSRKSGNVSLRRSKILSSILEPLEADEIMDVLWQTAVFCVPSSEYDYSETSVIFKKAIRVKRIRNGKLLSPIMIQDLLQSIEPICNHISYFWVQYGISAQELGKFEDANNHLSYAKNMRPNSYQVRHALAKNNMEWSIVLTKSGYIDIGKEKFKEGAEELKDLIHNPRYSKSFRYSAHTMINLWLQYTELIHEDIPEDQIVEIIGYLNKILAGTLDKILIAIIKQFICFCEKNGFGAFCDSLRQVYKRRVDVVVNKEAYEIM